MSGSPAKNKITPDCAAFQSELPNLFATEQDLRSQPHLKTCENCRSLVQDLKYIADQAKLLLPIHDPSPKVWDNIQSAIKKDEPLAK